MRYYYKIHMCGNRIHILPQLSFVALSTLFVVIEATYCSKMHCCCNMIAILRQFCFVAWISHFVVIATRYYNKISFHGNTQKDIATSLVCCISYGYCCKSWLRIATKHVLVVIVHFLPQFHCLAIAISYCNKLCVRGNMYDILQQSLMVEKKVQEIATIYCGL
jgi:hypothetical protein